MPLVQLTYVDGHKCDTSLKQNDIIAFGYKHNGKFSF